MSAPWTPFRWPASWKDPSALSLLEDAPVDHILIGDSPDLEPVRTAALGRQLTTGTPPAAAAVVKGEWPGVRISRGAAQAEAGPTGAPWVDSNGWAVRLAAARHPESAVWVDAPPPRNARLPAEAYLLAIADAAAHGGRWIITLDDQLAAALAARNPQALAAWNRITTAARFFAAHDRWAEYAAVAVAGVISDFSGPNEFFGQELLNLLSRAGLHHRILLKSSPPDFSGLRALIYADAEPPAPDLRKRILAFVEAGGLLITVPRWGAAPGPLLANDSHPRYTFRAAGKGRIAQANADPDDPYVFANDAVVLVSHRYDLVRFWNGGATGSFFTVAPDRRQAVVHLLFYANRGPDSASVRIAGRFRGVRAATFDTASPQPEVQTQKDAVEVHLPQLGQYVALEECAPQSAAASRPGGE
jgi:hypothetical protein